FPLYAQMLIVLAIGLQLTVVALVSVFTARRLHRSRSLLRRQNLELESRGQERTAELVAANRRLSEENAERKRAEQALRQSETRYALATEAARVGVWDWDLTTGRIYIDPLVKTFFGYGPDELTNLSDEWAGRIVHPDDRGRLMDLALAVQQGETNEYNIEYRMLDKKGGRHWVMTRGTVHRDANGRAIRIVGSTIDIDELKNIEEQLKTSEQKFAAAFKSSPAIVSLSSLDEGRFLDVNKNFLKVLGYTREEVIGRTSAELAIWAHPGDRQRVLAAMTEGEVRDIEVQIRTKSGDVRDFSWSAGIVQMEGGQALLTSAVDVTDRKRTQRERDRLIVELQEALERVKTLRGLIPICAQCKKIRDDQGYWHQVETYVRDHSEAEFSHGICPDCMTKLYPEHRNDGPD
ncbi:MAG: PAS domain S-box protein, partial [Proteobacteria bacterium]|nr:PAS domain S-box protein [Pseudomonadota bacterium]